VPLPTSFVVKNGSNSRLLDLGRVGLDAPERRSEHGDELDLFPDHAAEERDGLRDECIEVDRAHLESLAASEGK
jgi:hypothetical protein